MRLIILGAGGYGKTVADIARQSGKYEQIYFLDDGQETSDLILGTCLEYMKFADGNTEMYPAFGNNEMRLDWMKKLSDAQIELPRLIHATAYVSPTAEVEAGTVVLPLAIINTDCHIRSGCIINCGSIVDHGCVIEEGVHISPGTVIKAENRIPRATKIEAGEVVASIPAMRENRMKTEVTFKNNGKLKLLIIVGTRPEIIRLAAVIKKCRNYFDTILAHTGQNYDYNLNGVFFHDLELDDPDVYLNAVGADLGETMGNIISESYKLMAEIKPDAVLVLGDTNSCLSVIGAKRLHIPIFHMEAGNRCKDECLPEETNRRIVDIISDVNMAYSEHARRYLADCGLPKERTYVTGSPMAEVLHDNLEKIEASDVHARLGLEKGKYILLSAHREENIDTEKNFLSLFEAINKIAEKYDMPILYSCHPRSRKRLEASGFQLDKRVIQHEPLGFHDYNCLQMNAFAVVSDSGTLPEESSFFTSVGHPFPAVCIRTSTERPEALDKGCFVLAGIDSNSLVQAVETAVAMNENGDYGIPVPDYVEENVSTKVVKIIQSYTGVVNKMVWRKF